MHVRYVPLSKQKLLEFLQVFDYGRSILHYERKTTSTKYYARSILHCERSTSQFQNYPFKHLTQFPLSIKAQIGTFPSHFSQTLLFWNSILLRTHQTLILTHYPDSTMAPKIAKKFRSKVAQEKGNAERAGSSRREKRPSSSRPPISPASKRSKSKHNVLEIIAQSRQRNKQKKNMQTLHSSTQDCKIN